MIRRADIFRSMPLISCRGRGGQKFTSYLEIRGRCGPIGLGGPGVILERPFREVLMLRVSSPLESRCLVMNLKLL